MGENGNKVPYEGAQMFSWEQESKYNKDFKFFFLLHLNYIYNLLSTLFSYYSKWAQFSRILFSLNNSTHKMIIKEIKTSNLQLFLSNIKFKKK